MVIASILYSANLSLLVPRLVRSCFMVSLSSRADRADDGGGDCGSATDLLISRQGTRPIARYFR